MPTLAKVLRAFDYSFDGVTSIHASVDQMVEVPDDMVDDLIKDRYITSEPGSGGQNKMLEGAPENTANLDGFGNQPEFVLAGGSTHGASYEIGGQTVYMAEIVQSAFDASNLSGPDWNSLGDEGRNEMIDANLTQRFAAVGATYVPGEHSNDGNGENDVGDGAKTETVKHPNADVEIPDEYAVSMKKVHVFTLVALAKKLGEDVATKAQAIPVIQAEIDRRAALKAG